MRLFFLFTGNLSEALQDMLGNMVNAIPKVAAALIIFIGGYILAKVIAKMLRKFLEKIKIDRFGDKLNEIDIVHKANLKIKISALISKIFYYILMVFVLVIATDVLGMAAVSELVMDIFKFLPNLLVAIIVLIIGLLLSEAIRSIVYTACNSLGIPSAKIISTFLFYFLFINVVISALSQAKINTEFLSQNLSLLIGGGVLAFAIGYGFASKDTVANFLGSFYAKEKFAVGDIVSLEGDTGEIIAMDRNSLTLQVDQKQIIFPLNKLMKNKIEIHSQKSNT
jgi:small-conductance mechanosensitive channel